MSSSGNTGEFCLCGLYPSGNGGDGSRIAVECQGRTTVEYLLIIQPRLAVTQQTLRSVVIEPACHVGGTQDSSCCLQEYLLYRPHRTQHCMCGPLAGMVTWPIQNLCSCWYTCWHRRFTFIRTSKI